MTRELLWVILVAVVWVIMTALAWSPVHKHMVTNIASARHQLDALGYQPLSGTVTRSEIGSVQDGRTTNYIPVLEVKVVDETYDVVMDPRAKTPFRGVVESFVDEHPVGSSMSVYADPGVTVTAVMLPGIRGYNAGRILAGIGFISISVAALAIIIAMAARIVVGAPHQGIRTDRAHPGRFHLRSYAVGPSLAGLVAVPIVTVILGIFLETTAPFAAVGAGMATLIWIGIPVLAWMIGWTLRTIWLVRRPRDLVVDVKAETLALPVLHLGVRPQTITFNQVGGFALAETRAHPTTTSPPSVWIELTHYDDAAEHKRLVFRALGRAHATRMIEWLEEATTR